MKDERGMDGDHILDIIHLPYVAADNPTTGKLQLSKDLYDRLVAHIAKYGWRKEWLFGLPFEVDGKLPDGTAHFTEQGTGSPMVSVPPNYEPTPAGQPVRYMLELSIDDHNKPTLTMKPYEEGV